MVIVAPAMRAPDESCTTPEIVPEFTCENSESDKNNTPRIAPSTWMAFSARATFRREFIAPPFQMSENMYKPLERAFEEKASDLWLRIALPGDEVKRNRRSVAAMVRRMGGLAPDLASTEPVPSGQHRMYTCSTF